jgi:hypothetical protein
VWALIYTVTLFALIDSFDPCFYALFTNIYVSALMVNYKYARRAGLAFIFAVYLGYFTIALLARTLLLVASLPMRYLGIALCVYGTFNLGLVLLKRARGLVGREDLVCREDDVACKVASRLELDKYVTRGVLVVLFIGLMSSFTILPCSAQLLFSYTLITLNMHVVTWTMLTLYYVLVFISPVIALYLAMIGFSKLKPYQQLIARNEWLVKLIGSLLMISVAVYILLRGEGLYAW